MLSVCMIVKNEAENLKKTLPQLVRHAAEVIVVDTGSSDDTVKVAEGLGARVEHFKWVNDFSAARNYSISFATQPWILWLDADEYLREEDLKEMAALLKKADQDAPGCQLIITESPYGETVRGKSYARAKAFRNKAGIHFERAINEQVVDARGEIVLGGILPIIIYHWGRNLGKDRMETKKERYERMYREHLKTHPSDPYVNFLLGNLLRESGAAQEAYAAYEKSAMNSGDDVRIKVDALTAKAELALNLKKAKESYLSAKQILDLFPENIPAKNIMATLLIGVGQREAAIQMLEEALQAAGESIDPIREKVMPRVILADAFRKSGNENKARECEAEAEKLKEQINGR
jgi:glycosyltransferase involved in cell wall biosynthesis